MLDRGQPVLPQMPAQKQAPQQTCHRPRPQPPQTCAPPPDLPEPSLFRPVNIGTSVKMSFVLAPELRQRRNLRLSMARSMWAAGQAVKAGSIPADTGPHRYGGQLAPQAGGVAGGSVPRRFRGAAARLSSDSQIHRVFSSSPASD